MNSRRLLITGCLGFLGQSVLKLSPPNLSWIGIDNRGPSSKPENLDRFLKVDITDNDSLAENLEKQEFDGIVHLAGLIHIDQSQPTDLERLFKTNTEGTLNVIRLLSKKGQGSFVYASSMTVYGPPQEISFLESHPTNPNSFYGLTKLMGEQIVRLYATQEYLSATILRFPGLFGETRESGAIYHFAKNAALVKPIRISTKGLGFWSCIHVEDAAKAIITICNDPSPPGVPATYNVSDGEEWDLERVARIFANKSDNPISIEIESPVGYVPCRLSADNLKARYPSLEIKTYERICQVFQYINKKYGK